METFLIEAYKTIIILSLQVSVGMYLSSILRMVCIYLFPKWELPKIDDDIEYRFEDQLQRWCIFVMLLAFSIIYVTKAKYFLIKKSDPVECTILNDNC